MSILIPENHERVGTKILPALGEFLCGIQIHVTLPAQKYVYFSKKPVYPSQINVASDHQLRLESTGRVYYLVLKKKYHKTHLMKFLPLCDHLRLVVQER